MVVWQGKVEFTHQCVTLQADIRRALVISAVCINVAVSHCVQL